MSAAAEPGSGKTLAYLLPAISSLVEKEQGVAPQPEGPLALVMVPTRCAHSLLTQGTSEGTHLSCKTNAGFDLHQV